MLRKFRGLMESFRSAINGAALCARSERNFRIHLVFAAYVLALAAMAGFDAVRFAVVLLCVALVLTAEMFNTVIELLCDRQERGYDRFIGAIKDIAAGAVLICALGAAAAGAALFFRRDVIKAVIATVSARPWTAVVLIAALPVAIIATKGRRSK